MLPVKYFKGEWSFAQFRIPPDTKTIVNFGPDNTINVITYDGKFYTAEFDPSKDSGECVVKVNQNIVV